MSYKLDIRPEAEADVTEAALWYEERTPGLGEEFVAEVERVPSDGFSKVHWPFE